MDYGLITGVEPPEGEAAAAFDAFEPARWAMGDTRRYAERVSLVDMTPQPDRASSGYALASNHELLALAPDGGEPLAVMLESGRYTVEWFDVTDRTTAQAEAVDITDLWTSFTAPFDGPAVVYLAHRD